MAPSRELESGIRNLEKRATLRREFLWAAFTGFLIPDSGFLALKEVYLVNREFE